MARYFYEFRCEYKNASYYDINNIPVRIEKFYESVDGDYIMELAVDDYLLQLVYLDDKFILFKGEDENGKKFKLYIHHNVNKKDVLNFFIKNSNLVTPDVIKYVNNFYKFSDEELLEALL